MREHTNREGSPEIHTRGQESHHQHAQVVIACIIIHECREPAAAEEEERPAAPAACRVLRIADPDKNRYRPEKQKNEKHAIVPLSHYAYYTYKGFK